MALAGGQLSLMALTSVEGTGRTRSRSSVAPKAYEGASGSIRSVPRGPNTNYTDDTVHLILPS